jgi:hypothetical protein
VAWKVFEAPGIEPAFPEKDQAINYAQNRARFRSGEIRILDYASLTQPASEQPCAANVSPKI